MTGIPARGAAAYAAHHKQVYPGDPVTVDAPLPPDRQGCL